MSTHKTAARSNRPHKDTAARRLPSQSRSRKSVSLCLKAAKDLIERDGIDGVTTKKIAKAAGLSVGTVYGYFPNKEAIIYRLGTTWMETIRTMISGLHPHLSDIPDPFAYFNRVVDKAIEQYESESALGPVINMLSAIPELREAEQKHDREVVESLQSAFSHYCPRADSKILQALARSIASMTHAALSDAIVYKTSDRSLAIGNLRVAGYSLIVHTLVPLKDQAR